MCEEADGNSIDTISGRGYDAIVPMYDHCDDMQRQISSFFQSERMTETEWVINLTHASASCFLTRTY